MNRLLFNQLDNTISSFEKIKLLSEKKWESITYDECWGFQFQQNSKWKPGLTEGELDEFEKEIGFKFPDQLRNFYSTMNGLDKPGINFSGDLKNEPAFRSTFYSFPEDLELIKAKIDWVLESNKISIEEIKLGKAPFIFPFFSHRFLIFNSKQQVLSMHGNDIIPWSENLAKGVAKDIFNFYNEKIGLDFGTTKFWLDELE